MDFKKLEWKKATDKHSLSIWRSNVDGVMRIVGYSIKQLPKERKRLSGKNYRISLNGNYLRIEPWGRIHEFKTLREAKVFAQQHHDNLIRSRVEED